MYILSGSDVSISSKVNKVTVIKHFSITTMRNIKIDSKRHEPRISVQNKCTKYPFNQVKRKNKLKFSMSKKLTNNSGHNNKAQTQQLPHLGVPTHNTFLYPRAARVSNRKCELRSVNRYCALLFLLSRGHRSTLGLLSSAAVTGLVL